MCSSPGYSVQRLSQDWFPATVRESVRAFEVLGGGFWIVWTVPAVTQPCDVPSRQGEGLMQPPEQMCVKRGEKEQVTAGLRVSPAAARGMKGGRWQLVSVCGVQTGPGVPSVDFPAG